MSPRLTLTLAGTNDVGLSRTRSDRHLADPGGDRRALPADAGVLVPADDRSAAALGSRVDPRAPRRRTVRVRRALRRRLVAHAVRAAVRAVSCIRQADAARARDARRRVSV